MLSSMTGAQNVDPLGTWEHVVERSLTHVPDHWTEFAIIVVSGNIGAAIIAAGLVATGNQPTGSRLLLGGMLIASVIGFALAYFSIQVGQLGTLGLLTGTEVVASIGIAASQFAMPLWVAHEARGSRLATSEALVRTSRPWLAFAAIFALLAPIPSKTAAKRRESVPGPRPRWLDAYNESQRSDRRAAFGTGSCLLGTWIVLTVCLTTTAPEAALVVTSVAVASAALAFLMGFRSQSQTSKELSRAFGSGGSLAD
jgi:drug/metabolite transporter (DMT)-like permease